MAKAAAKSNRLLARENKLLLAQRAALLEEVKETSRFFDIEQERAVVAERRLNALVAAIEKSPKLIPGTTIEFPDANTTLVVDREGRAFWLHGVHKTITPA